MVTRRRIQFSQAPDETADFRLRVSYFGYFIDLVKQKEMKRIITVGNLAFHQKTINAFEKLNRKEKDHFLTDYFIELNSLRPSFYVQPQQPKSIEVIASIIIEDIIFVEDLTKTSLFESMTYVKRSMTLSNFSSARLLGIDISEQNNNSGLPGMG